MILLPFVLAAFARGEDLTGDAAEAEVQTILQNVEASAAKIKCISLNFSTEIHLAYPNRPPSDDVYTGREMIAGANYRFAVCSQNMQWEDSSSHALTMHREIIFTLWRPEFVTSWIPGTLSTIYDIADPDAIPRQAYIFSSSPFEGYYARDAFYIHLRPLRKSLIQPGLSHTIVTATDGSMIVSGLWKGQTVSRIVIDPARGWSIRSGDFGMSLAHPSERVAVVADEVTSGSGQWCPRTVEKWRYGSNGDHPLVSHWKATLSNVVTRDHIDDNDFSLAQFGMVRGEKFMRCSVTGKAETVYWDGAQMVDEETAEKNGIKQLSDDLEQRRVDRNRQAQQHSSTNEH